jgi:alkanesulfonate monooxygenase SsuD/methylene tetrahydromethanopterin reductase-like flavin-dependent oxidoreductase (luciferase family)
VASVDLLSNGRFVLGLGGGWNVEEMNHHGAEYDTRFDKLEERVAAMKAIWTQDEAEYHGEHVDFEPIWSWPKPVQTPHPPIVLGGATGYTRQRVVDFCDGWLPIGYSAEAVLKGMKDLTRRAEEAGRDRSTITVSVFGARPERETPDAYENGGVDRAVLMVKPEGRDQVLNRLDSFRELVG